MATYRIDWTEIKPGGERERQCDLVHGRVNDVRIYLAKYARRDAVDWAAGVTVTEFTQSDSIGRVLPLYSA